MINFESIRGYSAGQRAAFEGIVCQLARRDVPAAGAIFRRIDGSGGDGGIEAYWLLADGSEVGYQAKYFIRSGSIDWRQIDKSVRAALANHPKLKRYVIAVPCDFTGRTGATGRGKTAWDHWDTHVAKWKKLARSRSRRAIEFVAWTADDLQSRLTEPEAAGLREYWFGDIELSRDWFKRQLEVAVAALDERYHPEDHVNVTTQKLAEFIGRHSRSCEALAEGFAKVKRHPIPPEFSRRGRFKPSALLVKRTRDAMSALVACASDVSRAPWDAWDVPAWTRCVDHAIANVRDIAQWTWKAKENAATSGVAGQFDYVIHQVHGLTNALGELKEMLGSSYLKAEATRAAIVVGRAGSGKSHLLAHMAEKAIHEGIPSLLILGQQLRPEALWPQILQRLGVVASRETFLKCLDAAAEAAGARGLLLVDAINEGPGAALWRQEIPSFLAEISRYPNLACVLSCRTEYVDYIVQPKLAAQLPRFEVHGFETLEEQTNAARVYLDQRGIARPATPWLAPEFVNPLFLRSCCNALQREKAHEFPRGLTGTKSILSFYVESVARHLGTGRDGTNDLVGPTKEALSSIAGAMATSKRDYLARADAERISNTCFASFPPPSELTWLDILLRNGLLRLDPNPQTEPQDPLKLPIDVVRFSFQRFQDHLVAEALLKGVVDATAAFAVGGTLNFVLNGLSVAWQWHGLLDALSTQIPEQLGIELVDALPDRETKWWRDWSIQRAFAESVRWRSKDSFTDRTLWLFNRIGASTETDQLSLLIELSASVDHPWNANLLHRNLMPKKMPKRDAFWSIRINAATDDETHPLHRLIDWCRHGQNAGPVEETQRLCALVLTWCFTCSSRPVRDQATKALTSLLLARKPLFAKIVAAFKGVDDPYVWERLFAAAYGACCIDPDPATVTDYATVALDTVFVPGKVPEHLLLRDYARGLVDLAASMNAMPHGATLDSSQPPYGSPSPRLNVTEAQVKAIATRAGGEAILGSCSSFGGDFGTYTLTHAVANFTAVRLTRPTPYTSREIFNRFETEIACTTEPRKRAWKQLRNSMIPNLFVMIAGKKRAQIDTHQPDPSGIVRAIEEALGRFLDLLAPNEQKRFSVEAAAYMDLPGAIKQRHIDPPSFDTKAAQYWVAARAYRIGWTKSRFPREQADNYPYSRERPRIERIGKKYQWLALNVLLARLADNYWMGGDVSERTRMYDSPLDIGFFRDIDPTVLQGSRGTPADQTGATWKHGPAIRLPDTAEKHLPQWPFLVDLAKGLPNLISRTDIGGRSWLVLYDHCSANNRYDKDNRRMEHGMRQQEFRFILSVIVKAHDVARFVDDISTKKSIDVMRWDPPEFTDGPFLWESPWRKLCHKPRWEDDGWNVPEGLPIARPLVEYRWEPHLDASMPEGASSLMPAAWLAADLKLQSDRRNSIRYFSADSQERFVWSRVPGSRTVALIDSERFLKYLRDNGLACVWLFVAERAVWPGGDNDRAASRRSEGCCWLAKDGKVRTKTWYRDHVRTPTMPR